MWPLHFFTLPRGQTLTGDNLQVCPEIVVVFPVFSTCPPPQSVRDYSSVSPSLFPFSQRPQVRPRGLTNYPQAPNMYCYCLPPSILATPSFCNQSLPSYLLTFPPPSLIDFLIPALGLPFCPTSLHPSFDPFSFFFSCNSPPPQPFHKSPVPSPKPIS